MKNKFQTFIKSYFFLECEVYTLRKYEKDRQHEMEIGNVVSESDESNSEEDISTIESPFKARANVLIKKRRESLRRKVTRNAKRKIAEERLLKRSRSRKGSPRVPRHRKSN